MGLLSMMRRLRREESGVVAPLAVLLLTVLLGFSALVLDVGTVLAQRRSLQNAADAAALAGARELQRGLLNVGPVDPDGEARLLAQRNGVSAAGAACPSSGVATVVQSTSGPVANSWQVVASRRVPLTFGRAIGVGWQCVSARATAVITDLEVAKIWPWAVLNGTLEAAGYGQTFTLKEGAGGSSSGNFGIVDFTCGGGGTAEYRGWAFTGYGNAAGERVPLRLPSAGGASWQICTETGNKAAVNKELGSWVSSPEAQACRYAGADVRCPLYGLVPILSETSWPNGMKPVHVVDFAVFKLESVGGDAGSKGNGKAEIRGQFLRYAGGIGPTYPPDPNGALSSLIGVRLWE